jgi:hypothetical protein
MGFTEYVLLLDDDTILADDAVFDEAHFTDDDVCAVGYPRRCLTLHMPVRRL